MSRWISRLFLFQQHLCIWMIYLHIDFFFTSFPEKNILIKWFSRHNLKLKLKSSLHTFNGHLNYIMWTIIGHLCHVRLPEITALGINLMGLNCWIYSIVWCFIVSFTFFISLSLAFCFDCLIGILCRFYEIKIHIIVNILKKSNDFVSEINSKYSIPFILNPVFQEQNCL